MIVMGRFIPCGDFLFLLDLCLGVEDDDAGVLELSSKGREEGLQM